MEILIIIAAVIMFFTTMRFMMMRKAAKFKGKEIDISLLDENTQNLLNQNKSMLYFYTPHCGACKSQAPIIDKLSEEIKSLGKIDLTGNIDVAREFGIMGTPTTMLMLKNRIAEIYVGVKQEKFLRTRFQEL
jgi:thiol-disulfide isomerase/thioredoxin